MAANLDPKTLKKYMIFGKGKNLDQETVTSIIDNFVKFDEDKSGELSPDELVRLMKEYFRLHYKVRLDLVERITKMKLQSVDKDKSGSLDLDEFFDLFVGVLEQIPAKQRVPLSKSDAQLLGSSNSESAETLSTSSSQAETFSSTRKLPEAENVVSRSIDFDSELATQEEEDEETRRKKNQGEKANTEELSAKTQENVSAKPEVEGVGSSGVNLAEETPQLHDVTSRAIDLESDISVEENEEEAKRRANQKVTEDRQREEEQRQQEEQKRRQEEERKQREEQERKQREEQERKQREEQERKQREEQERKQREEQERKQREEQERKQREEQERKQREEQERKQREEQERNQREEQERKQREEQERKQREEQERRQQEEQRQLQDQQRKHEQPQHTKKAEEKDDSTRIPVKIIQKSSKKKPSQEEGISRVSFNLHYDTSFGENLFVVGEGSQLGNWIPEQGLRMAWWPGNYWSIEADLPSGDLNFKYAVVELNDGPWYVTRWEETSQRSLALHQPTHRIDFPWNN